MALPASLSVGLGYEIDTGTLTVPSGSVGSWTVVRVAAPTGKVPIYGEITDDPNTLPAGFHCQSFPDATGSYPGLSGNGGWAFQVPFDAGSYTVNYRVIFTNA